MINQLTIAHKRWDTRIWVKEISILKTAGLLNSYEVADGKGDMVKNGVMIRDLGALNGRGFWPRMRLILKAVQRTRASKGEVIHFHDPLFLPGAIWLKLKGRRIVYDVHEDYPRQVLNWQLPALIRYGASFTYAVLEWLAGTLFDGIITATPKIAERFPAKKTVVVQNFPILGELILPEATPYGDRPLQVVYIGGMATVRGIAKMVKAMELLPEKLNARLVLAGEFSPACLHDEVQQLPGWERVEFLGWQTRNGVASLLADARVGLVVLHPTINYLESYPVKLFEYMSAGIPVVASDFPLWRQIIEDADCGLLVDPLNPMAIAEAIKWLLENPEEAEAMGKRGQEAVRERYNWNVEAKKLLTFYEEILE